MPKSDRKQQRGGFLGGQPHQTKSFSKRARENSSEYEDLEDDDPDVIVDALVRALNNSKVMSKFIECICSSKVLVNSLIRNLIPTLHEIL